MIAFNFSKKKIFMKTKIEAKKNQTFFFLFAQVQMPMHWYKYALNK